MIDVTYREKRSNKKDKNGKRQLAKNNNNVPDRLFVLVTKNKIIRYKKGIRILFSFHDEYFFININCWDYEQK